MPFDVDKLKKIQEHALSSLETDDIPEHMPLEPEVSGKWRHLSDRKWEFRFNDIVLATIFHKPTNNKFSLFCKTPDMYKKIHQIAADTFLFDTWDEATSAFPKILEERAGAWTRTVVEFLDR